MFVHTQPRWARRKNEREIVDCALHAGSLRRHDTGDATGERLAVGDEMNVLQQVEAVSLIHSLGGRPAIFLPAGERVLDKNFFGGDPRLGLNFVGKNVDLEATLRNRMRLGNSIRNEQDYSEQQDARPANGLGSAEPALKPAEAGASSGTPPMDALLTSKCVKFIGGASRMGCEPAIRGSLPRIGQARANSKCTSSHWQSAGRRLLQAGSLPSPETGHV